MATVISLIISAMASIITLLAATTELASKKVYQNKEDEYPIYLEFNSALAFYISITLNTASSVILGVFVARYINPGDYGVPNVGMAMLFFVIWSICFIISTALLSKAKVVRLKWLDQKSYKKYPITISFYISLLTLIAMSLLLISTTAFAVLIGQTVVKFF